MVPMRAQASLPFRSSYFVILLYYLSFLLISSQHVSEASQRDTESLAISAGGKPDYPCGPGKPCPNGACCGESGWCGYGPDYCGKGCQSHCDAKAECGKYAAIPGTGCPLNVCCSQLGFCGTTPGFCGTGCQSNCQKPEHKGSKGTARSRIVGYWEARNTQNACGQMGPGAIPVNLLTHLNVAHAYINPAFQVTNMDGVSPSLYQSIGDVKARNPNLKLMLALGGWSFSNPGPWRNVFPAMVSTKANRSTLIKNLLSFLSHYGYDGVDFDWEFPGAADRGGSSKDGVNYTDFLKELHDAIQASGKKYIVTFAAPTSYRYLRHFDLANMIQYVDWVNLLSYDLHGVWDGSNPGGNQVQGHTNLTQIDQALDLFWRVGVEPSKIVMGLAFYGRSFQLADASCWKPGCAFSGPGAAGRCTNMPGILSYREITDILRKTGATSSLDEKDAVRYMVYGDKNWISYDDEVTFAAKIDYAEKKGLSGLMIWAVDMDDASRTALRAVAGDGASGGVTRRDTAGESHRELVDVRNLFPEKYRPGHGSTSSYGLVSFGVSDPSETGFGFALVTGDTHVVSSLRKRDGEPEPFVFIDCPANINQNETHRARVVCLADDVEGCFRVMERGVEGTIVEMPDDCSPNNFARAISLQESADQSMPGHLLRRKRSPTSRVMDFHFDFDLERRRTDTNNTRLQVEYSNVPGYWNKFFDTGPIQSRSLKNISHLSSYLAQSSTKSQSKASTKFDHSDKVIALKSDLTKFLYWDTVHDCPEDGGKFPQGFGVYVKGHLDATFSYSFSLVAELGKELKIKEARGQFDVRGKTDLTYTIFGEGQVDVSGARKGNPSVWAETPVYLDDTWMRATRAPIIGTVRFDPYYQITYEVATLTGTETGSAGNSTAPFDGRLETHIITDLGNFSAVFPPDADEAFRDDHKRQQNKIELAKNNVLYSSNGDGGKISVGTLVQMGLEIHVDLRPTQLEVDANLALVYNTLTEFTTYPDKGGKAACAKYEIVTDVFQKVQGAKELGWDENYQSTNALAYDDQTPGHGPVCFPLFPGSDKARKRDALGELASNDHCVQDAGSGECLPESDSSVEEDEPLDEQEDEQHNNATQTRKKSKRQNGTKEHNEWGVDQGQNDVNPLNYVSEEQLNKEAAKGKPLMHCGPDKCSSCLATLDKDEKTACCGCVQMDQKYGYSDISDCGSCNPDDGQWPGQLPDSVSARRGLDSDADEAEEGVEVVTNDLSKRARGQVNPSAKQVSICGVKVKLGQDGRYPPFPADSSWPWDGIEGGKWDPISRYWGNSSADCRDWRVKKMEPADTTFVTQGGKVHEVRAKYQTEHVFEGQLIADFFDRWLVEGKVNNQLPTPQNVHPKLACKVIEKWILGKDDKTPWTIDGKQAPFVHLMLAELGSIRHLDRLTIMQARPNQKKGAMFTGNQPTRQLKFQRDMDHDARLQSVKEMGLVFNYLNAPSVWAMFCATYEGIYRKLGDFDTWFARQHGTGVTIPNLQAEWKEYVRVALDSMVLRSQDTFDWMYANAWPLNDQEEKIYRDLWYFNYAFNRVDLYVSGRCSHMDESTVPKLHSVGSSLHNKVAGLDSDYERWRNATE